MTLQPKKQILIVEDMANWREVLVEILQAEYEVILSQTYSEAIDLLDKRDFSLVILDVRLEDEESRNIQGIEILRFIKENYSHIPAIILTGHPESLRPETLEQYKPDVFLLKETLDIKSFVAYIHQLIKENPGQ